MGCTKATGVRGEHLLREEHLRTGYVPPHPMQFAAMYFHLFWCVSYSETIHSPCVSVLDAPLPEQGTLLGTGRALAHTGTQTPGAQNEHRLLR